MDLETVIQSEVNQKEKNHVLMHIFGIQKNGTDEPISKEGVEHKPREWTSEHRGKMRVG